MKKKNLFFRDKTIISSKVKESFSSVLPITFIILLLSATLTPLDSGVMLVFILGALLVVFGMGLFTLGADSAMTPIGSYVGAEVVKSKRLWIIIPVYFIVGVLITIAEPDLQVLAHELAGSFSSSYVLLITVGVGVGVFLVIAFLRIVLKIKLKYLLLIFYVAVFALAFYMSSIGLEGLVPLSFDSGGVTTGPMSVPFIIAIGTGVAALRSDNGAEEDGFGLTALCSIGPILSVMILGVIFRPNITTTEEGINTITNSKELFKLFGASFPKYFKEVGVALLPIVAVFFAVRLFGGSKLGKSGLIKILVGLAYTYIGLVLFLTGVNVGFFPVGKLIGSMIGGLSYNWILVPIGAVLGFFVVAVEPAVHVLTVQVYEITSGAIPKKALSISLMIGVAFAVGLAMLRIILEINLLYFLIPGYLIALVLMFFVPEIFTAVAFDSGGVASGAMASGFLLPLALGVCTAVGGNVATEGYGLVAMIAMIPLISIQILGLVYRIKSERSRKESLSASKRKEKILD